MKDNYEQKADSLESVIEGIKEEVSSAEILAERKTKLTDACEKLDESYNKLPKQRDAAIAVMTREKTFALLDDIPKTSAEVKNGDVSQFASLEEVQINIH